MAGKSGKGGKGFRTPLGVAAILLVGLASVAFYASVSATVNGEPSTSPFPGFVVLLQEADRFSQDQVKLIAAPLVPGGPGQQPALSYQVTVCGNQSFSGVLVIGGEARLSHLQGIPALGTKTASEQSSIQDLPDVTFLDEGNAVGIPLDLGPVQAIHITMPTPSKMRFRVLHAADPAAVPRPGAGHYRSGRRTRRAAVAAWMVGRPAQQPVLAPDRRSSRDQRS